MELESWSFDKPRCMGLPQRGSAARQFATAKALISCWSPCRTKTKAKLANTYEADEREQKSSEKSCCAPRIEDAPLREAKESWKHWEQAETRRHRLDKKCASTMRAASRR